MSGIKKLLTGKRKSSQKLNVTGKDSRNPSSENIFMISKSRSSINLAGEGLSSYIVREKDLSKLCKAVWQGDLLKLKLVVSNKKKVNWNDSDKEKRTLLHLASSQGFEEVVEYLISNGANVNVSDSEGKTPLMKACESNSLKIVENLLNNGAETNVCDLNQVSAIHIAAAQGSIDIGVMLADRDAKLDVKDRNRITPLHLSCALGNKDFAEFLLSEYVEVNCTDAQKRTPLMAACIDGHPDIVKLLLESNCDISLFDADGNSARKLAEDFENSLCTMSITDHEKKMKSKDDLLSPASQSPNEMFSSPGPSTNPMFPGTMKMPVFGGPAVDVEPADRSEESQSEELGGSNSWADTDSDSEMRKKPKAINFSALLKSKTQDSEKIEGRKCSGKEPAKETPVVGGNVVPKPTPDYEVVTKQEAISSTKHIDEDISKPSAQLKSNVISDLPSLSSQVDTSDFSDLPLSGLNATKSLDKLEQQTDKQNDKNNNLDNSFTYSDSKWDSNDDDEDGEDDNKCHASEPPSKTLQKPDLDLKMLDNKMAPENDESDWDSELTSEASEVVLPPRTPEKLSEFEPLSSDEVDVDHVNKALSPLPTTFENMNNGENINDVDESNDSDLEEMFSPKKPVKSTMVENTKSDKVLASNESGSVIVGGSLYTSSTILPTNSQEVGNAFSSAMVIPGGHDDEHSDGDESDDGKNLSESFDTERKLKLQALGILSSGEEAESEIEETESEWEAEQRLKKLKKNGIYVSQLSGDAINTQTVEVSEPGGSSDALLADKIAKELRQEMLDEDDDDDDSDCEDDNGDDDSFEDFSLSEGKDSTQNSDETGNSKEKIQSDATKEEPNELPGNEVLASNESGSVIVDGALYTSSTILPILPREVGNPFSSAMVIPGGHNDENSDEDESDDGKNLNENEGKTGSPVAACEGTTNNILSKMNRNDDENEDVVFDSSDDFSLDSKSDCEEISTSNGKQIEENSSEFEGLQGDKIDAMEIQCEEEVNNKKMLDDVTIVNSHSEKSPQNQENVEDNDLFVENAQERLNKAKNENVDDVLRGENESNEDSKEEENDDLSLSKNGSVNSVVFDNGSDAVNSNYQGGNTLTEVENNRQHTAETRLPESPAKKKKDKAIKRDNVNGLTSKCRDQVTSKQVKDSLISEKNAKAEHTDDTQLPHVRMKELEMEYLEEIKHEELARLQKMADKEQQLQNEIDRVQREREEFEVRAEAERIRLEANLKIEFERKMELLEKEESQRLENVVLRENEIALAERSFHEGVKKEEDALKRRFENEENRFNEELEGKKELLRKFSIEGKEKMKLVEEYEKKLKEAEEVYEASMNKMKNEETLMKEKEEQMKLLEEEHKKYMEGVEGGHHFEEDLSQSLEEEMRKKIAEEERLLMQELKVKLEREAEDAKRKLSCDSKVLLEQLRQEQELKLTEILSESAEREAKFKERSEELERTYKVKLQSLSNTAMETKFQNMPREQNVEIEREKKHRAEIEKETEKRENELMKKIELLEMEKSVKEEQWRLITKQMIQKDQLNKFLEDAEAKEIKEDVTLFGEALQGSADPHGADEPIQNDRSLKIDIQCNPEDNAETNAVFHPSKPQSSEVFLRDIETSNLKDTMAAAFMSNDMMGRNSFQRVSTPLKGSSSYFALADLQDGRRLNSKTELVWNERIDGLLNSTGVENEKHRLDSELLLRSVTFKLEQEIEGKKMAEKLYEQIKEQMLRTEHRLLSETEKRQTVELTNQKQVSSIKQLENQIQKLQTEKNELQSVLDVEKQSRQFQEELYEQQLRQHELILKEAQKSSQKLQVMDETRKYVENSAEEMKINIAKLKGELSRVTSQHEEYKSRMEVDVSSVRDQLKTKDSHISVMEKEILQLQLACENEKSMKIAQDEKMKMNLENEQYSKQLLLDQVSSLNTRLEKSSYELEAVSKAKLGVDKELIVAREKSSFENLHWEKDLNSLKQLLKTTEAKVKTLEENLNAANEQLQSNNLRLVEKKGECQRVQQELQNAIGTAKGLESQLFNEKESTKTFMMALKSDFQKDREELVMKNEQSSFLLSKQEKNNRELEAKLIEKTANCERLADVLSEAKSNLSDACNRNELLTKEKEHSAKRNEKFDEKLAELKEEITLLEKEKACSQKKLAELTLQLDKTVHLNDKACEKLAESSSDVEKIRSSNARLEEGLYGLRKENENIDAQFREEKAKAEILLQDLHSANQARDGLETLLSNAKGNTLALEERLHTESLNRTQREREVKEHKGLWESEVKSRSILGVKILDMEKEIEHLKSQIDEEKRKTRRAVDSKKGLDGKLEVYEQRSSQHQKEMVNIRNKLKQYQKRLKAAEGGDSRISSIYAEFDRERQAMFANVTSLRKQLEEFSEKLNQEHVLRSSAEENNKAQLKELSDLKAKEKVHEYEREKWEKNMRSLKEDIVNQRKHYEQNFAPREELEGYKRDMETKARLDVNKKLQEVNMHLEEQSLARETFEKIRAEKEGKTRKEMEETISQLKVELNLIRTSMHEGLAKRDTSEMHAKRFQELFESEKTFSNRLSEKLNLERHRADVLFDEAINRPEVSKRLFDDSPKKPTSSYHDEFSHPTSFYRSKLWSTPAVTNSRAPERDYLELMRKRNVLS